MIALGSNEAVTRTSRRVVQLPTEFMKLKNRMPKKKNQYNRQTSNKQKQQDEVNTTGIPAAPKRIVVELEKISIFPKLKIDTLEVPKEF